jgi:hypothetical protein
VLVVPGTTAVLVAPGTVVVLLSPGVTEVLVCAAGVLLLDWPGTVVVESFTSEEVVVLTTGGLVVVAGLVVVLGGLVLDAVLQSKEMVGTLMLQLGLGLLGWGG